MSEMELHELFEQGYHFIASSYWGDSDFEEWEDVVEAYHEADDDEWSSVEVFVDHEDHMVQLWYDCDE